MSDPFRRFFENDREMRRLLDPLGSAAAGLDPYGGAVARASAGLEMSRLLDERADLEAQAMGFLSADKYRSVAFEMIQREPTGTESYLRDMIASDRATARAAAGVHDSTIADLMAEAIGAHRTWEDAFRLPQIHEAERLLMEEMSGARNAARLFAEAGGRDAAIAAMEAMTQPWLNEAALGRSVAGFVEMHALGAALKTVQPFASEMAKALRPALGDWRDAETPDLAVLLDPVTRTALYYYHGFSPDLTAFPRPAFIEGLHRAGLDLEAPATAPPADDDDEPSADTSEDAEFARNRSAFDQLQRFEVAVRRFIDGAMTEAFGANWISNRIPPEIADRWRDKQAIDFKATGTNLALIEYADFTDYRVIIERSDNWKAVFKPVFKRPTDIQESFQRLFPVRIATMHARMITQDDEMMLTVETRRILRAIRSAR